MYSCSECADLLLDFLYGLLEPEEVQRLRAHLADCPACQAALADAETHKRLLARAARVAHEVPVFVAPSEADVGDKSTPAASEAAVVAGLPDRATTAAPATESVTLPLPRPRRSWRWAWLAAAAALLLAAGGVYWSYEDGLMRRHADLSQAKHEVEAVDARLASVARSYEGELAQLPAQARARELRLQIAGPATYQADAPAQLRIKTQDASGNSRAARLDVAVKDPAAGNKALFTQHLDSSGETAVAVPLGLPVQPGGEAQLVVKAATDLGGEAKLSEILTVSAPSYDTHVVLNKPAYRPGEVVSFRTLTLSRFSQKPPQRELPLTFTLRDSRNAVVRQLQGKTRPDGIAGGEFPLSGLPAEADYTLEVASTAKDTPVLPRARRFTILRDELALYANLGRGNAAANQVNFDRDLYAPGDTVRGEFRQTQNQTARQSITVNARQANGQTIPLTGASQGKPLKKVTDAEGRARFEFQLPHDVGAGRPVVEVEVHDGVANARIQRNIPMAPPYPEMEFFPEGGDLIAGISDRVYFRAQTPQGAPADVQGRVVDREGKEVARVQRRSEDTPALRGLGSFTFAPQAGETYTFQMDVGPNTSKVVPLPAVHRTGISLSAPQGVSREGDPIAAVVSSSVPVQGLLVLASCRGNIVDQQFVDAGPKGSEMRLRPVEGTRGVVRLTVNEVRQSELLPRAERLIYVMPAQRLVVSCADPKKADARSYRPGEHVELGIKVMNEKGEPATATLFAAAVDQRALVLGPAEQGPPAFFYLTSEIRDGADLDDADFLVSDTPEARAALDLFLGTQGWRRFGAADSASAADKNVAAGAAALDRPVVFSRNNFEESAASAAQFLAARQEELRRKAVRERGALQDDRERCILAVNAAAASLAEYQQLPQRGARLAVGVLVLLLLAAGGVLLLVGVVRMLLGRRPTTVFGAAFSSLLLCLVLYGATGEWRQQTGPREDAGWAFKKDRAPQAFPGNLAKQAGAQDLKAANGAAPAGRFLEPRQTQLPLATTEDLRRGLQVRERGLAEESRRRAVLDDLSGDKQVDMKRSNLEQEAAKGGIRTKSKESSPFGGNMPAPASDAVPPPPAPAGAASRARPSPEQAPANSPSAPDRGQLRAATARSAGKSELTIAPALRSFAYRQTARLGGVAPDTVLWYPALLAADGAARIAFDLPDQPASYRLLLYASSPSGRLGAYRAQIDARK